MSERDDVDALTIVLRRGAHNVRAQDESRHEAQGRAVLASDWLAAHVAAARAEERERLAREVLDEFDTWTAYETRDIGAAFLAESVHELLAPLRALVAPEPRETP